MTKPLQGLCAHRFKLFSKQLHLTAQKTILFVVITCIIVVVFCCNGPKFLLLSNCMADYYRAAKCFQKSLDVNLNQLLLVYLR